MAEPVFFSFHYERDVSRAWQVRNSWVTQSGGDAGFDDRGLREAVKRNDDKGIRAAINRGLRETSVTAVLIGAETACRPWVQYEIARTFERGNALLGIYIHNVKCMQTRKGDRKGANPFRFVDVEIDEGGFFGERWVTKSLWNAHRDAIPMFDWVEDGGYENLGDWIEQAVADCAWA
ncbi:MAG: TIR domain-containing protein [Planctomycetes bacterium]|nr:TIR domain-containing protein [Planctomycetota bacterium]